MPPTTPPFARAIGDSPLSTPISGAILYDTALQSWRTCQKTKK
jgi:hypothetical protein